MTGGPAIFLGGYALSFIGAIIIALVVIGQRRGGARLFGLLGALLIMAGAIVPVFAELSGNSLVAISPEAGVDFSRRGETADTLLAALPGTLIGFGLIGVALAAIRPGPAVGSASVPRSAS